MRENEYRGCLTMNNSLIKEFENPGSEYRGAPFWAWNGKLDPDELRAQIRLMRKMGLGGFFMHSRVGLDTAYLSDDWFKCVEACVDEAKTLGMRAWLYDEDRWPSGFAGGIVTKNKAFRKRNLVMHVAGDAGEFKWTKDILAAFTARVDERKTPDCAFEVKQLAKGEKPSLLPDGHVILSFSIELVSGGSWFGNQGYVDTMNPAAIREFIRVTHEEYRKRVGGEFGKTVPGIFTDEPYHGKVGWKTKSGEFCQPWTDNLPAVFKRRYGYDVIPLLPDLFYMVNGQPCSRVRYHYNECITHLFVDAFARQIGEWCGRNDMLFTGHVLEEDTVLGQAKEVGSCMRFYEHMQAPGMDMLTEKWRLYDTAKQVASVARQFDRKWRITETYGCTGWDFPFLGHKALGDWQVALGINVRCHHLAWYTMLGEAKRDYPASMSYQSPWWAHYSKVEDYFARVHAVMTRGEEVRDLLVIHPVESMWLFSRKNWRLGAERAIELSRSLVTLRETLLCDGIDFDYGDEEIMSRHGSVAETDGEPLLRIGAAKYRIVAVPPMQTMRSTTLALLRKFQQRGGQVVFAGDIPAMLDAAPSAAVLDFATHCVKVPHSGPELVRAVESKSRRLSIKDAAGGNIPSTLHLLREDAANFYLFVCNTGHSREQLRRDMFEDAVVKERTTGYPDVRIRGFKGCAGEPLLLDADTGMAFTADHEKKDGQMVIRTSLPPCGSRLFVVPKAAGASGYPALPRLVDAGVSKLEQERWPVTLSENNVLVLDKPAFRLADGEWQTAGDVLKVDGAIRKTMGLPPRGGSLQPWLRAKPGNPKIARVALRYSFNVEERPTGDLYLAIESPRLYRIAVNGVDICGDVECGWWCDKSLRKLVVDPALVRIGGNEVTMETGYRENHPGLEIVYLLGSFGVRLD
ncbi:MAG: hypothetical protein C0404_11295, partial [Verrucomicrobia bacterium]|nr:hypothetical protein [Verrucomicrobiota bacterium]